MITIPSGCFAVMRKTISVLIIMIFGVFPSMANRESHESGPVLTTRVPAGNELTDPGLLILNLETAFRLALTFNSDIQRADLDIESFRIGVDRAERQYHPSLSLSGSTSARWSEPTAPGRDAVTHSANIRLGSGYTVFNGFTDSANRDTARLELAGSERTADRIIEKILFQVTGRFLDAAAAMEQIRVQRENVYAQRELLGKIEAFFESGKRPVADLYQQQAETALAEFRLLNVERDFELKKLALLDQLGLSAGRPVQIDLDGLDDLRAFPEMLPGPENALTTAKNNRSDYLAAKDSQAAAEYAVRAARGGFWPNLSLSMETGTTYSGSANRSWTDQFVKDNPYASIGLSVSFPIYDRHQTRHSVASAELRYRRAQIAVRDLERQMENEILTAHLEYQTAVKQLESARAQINFTSRALENYEQRYTVNAATLLEVIQARANHLNAIYEKIAAEYNLTEKALAITYYAGELEKRIHYLTPETGNILVREGDNQ